MHQKKKKGPDLFNVTRADCKVLDGTRRVAGSVVWTALALKRSIN